jgi:HAD superfamily hydrolase (TIGR01549 family)
MVRAILFDIDGTLVDSNALHVEAWRDAFRHFGKELTAAEVHRQIGKGGDQLIPVFCTKEEIAEFGEELEKLRAEIFRRDYAPRVQPFPKVRPLFERLRRDGIRIALASSSKQQEVQDNAKKLGVEDVIDATTSADDVEHSKPSPDVFRAALDALRDVDARDAIVIGDTPYDVIAARRAGLRTIGLRSGGFSADDLAGAGAIEIYREVAELLEQYDASAIGREISSAPRAD